MTSGIWLSALLLAMFANTACTDERHIAANATGQWYGCTSKDYFKKLDDYAAQNDSDAYKRGLADGVLSGVCRPFGRGEFVFITDTAIFAGMFRVRRKGDTSGADHDKIAIETVGRLRFPNHKVAV